MEFSVFGVIVGKQRLVYADRMSAKNGYGPHSVTYSKWTYIVGWYMGYVTKERLDLT